MRPTQSNRVVMPVIPRPGAEVVSKKVSTLPPGSVVCTVSYLKSTKPMGIPLKKRHFLSRFAGILSFFRAKLSRFGAK